MLKTAQLSQTLIFRLPITTNSSRSYATHIKSGGSGDPTAYCKQLVQKHDYESYLTSYFYPRHLQPAYFAIRAFNIELATVRESVSTTAIGQMRMQFWRDAIKGIYQDKPPQHPIALALHQATKQADLPEGHFKRIIDARDADLLNPTHMKLATLRTYAESTSSTIFSLLLSLLSVPSTSPYTHAASHLGVAQTLGTLLRALPFHVSKGHIVIPAEITTRHMVNQEEVLRKGPAAYGISDAVFELACVAKEDLDSARDAFEADIVPNEVLPVFLSGVPIASYLARLEAANFDAFDPSLQAKDWKLPFRMWRSSSKRTF